jgi:hypothetical protein
MLPLRKVASLEASAGCGNHHFDVIILPFEQQLPDNKNHGHRI